MADYEAYLGVTFNRKVDDTASQYTAQLHGERVEQLDDVLAMFAETLRCMGFTTVVGLAAYNETGDDCGDSGEAV